MYRRLSSFFSFLLILFWVTTTQGQSWTQLTWSGNTPSQRYSHTAVYDNTNNRMIIFGGGLNDAWVLQNSNGLGIPIWDQLTWSSNTPSARGSPSAVFDASYNRMIIFGGQETNPSFAFLNDIWVLQNANGLGGGPVWTKLSPTGSAPTTRWAHTAVYDDAHNRMVIFGGFYNDIYGNGPTTFNDVWVLTNANGLGGTPAWTKLFPSGTPPSGRVNASSVYDPVNNRMTVFGGDDYLNDVWVLTNANGLGGTPAWIQLSPAGNLPSARHGHTGVYDSAHNRMTIFGGYRVVLNYLNDVWVLTNANGLGGTPAWSQILPIGELPPGRYAPTAVYDITNNLMTIFGGHDYENTFNDVWVLSTANGLAPPRPGFYATPTSGEGPLNVSFIDTSSNVPTSWNWSFGDGSTSILNNPTHVYSMVSASTTYTVTLIVSNSLGTDSAIYSNYILINTPSPPIAGFYGFPTAGEGPLQVELLDNSANNPDTWLWDFGDGNNSNQQNTFHTYASVTTPTTYTVQLIARNYFGENTATYVDFVTVNPPSPPLFSTLPGLKLFSNQSLANALFLEDYNTLDPATGYSILNNFAGLSLLDGSTVSQGAYGSPTTGENMFIVGNTVGNSTASNKVKYSTYKILKLPKVGLTPGSSWNVDVSQYTYDSSGKSFPPSFGNSYSLNVSDTTNIVVTWLGNTVIHISSLKSFSGEASVDVIASPNAIAPFDSDMDKERIHIYPNLLTHSTLSVANETTTWSPLELAPGKTALATQNWQTEYTDSAGTQASGVWRFTFSNSNSGVKATPKASSWIPMFSGKWYTLRMRVVADKPNSHQSILLGFKNRVGTGIQTEISANALFGIPTTWTWLETALQIHGASTSGYPQFQFKASTSGNVYIDEFQIINTAPSLINANRNNTRLHYPYGVFNTSSDTTGWGQELYNGSGSPPSISIFNNQLQLNFSNASSGTNQKGIKWTANNGDVLAATYPVNPDKEMGVRATVTLEAGTFNSLGIILLSAYGVQTSGQQNIGISPGNIMATAGVGTLISGTYRAIATAVNPYYQFQFGIRSDQPGIIAVDDVDFDRDQDDPNYGDGTLFP